MRGIRIVFGPDEAHDLPIQAIVRYVLADHAVPHRVLEVIGLAFGVNRLGQRMIMVPDFHHLGIWPFQQQWLRACSQTTKPSRTIKMEAEQYRRLALAGIAWFLR